MSKGRGFELHQSLQRSTKGKAARSLLQILLRSRLGRTLISMTTRFAISQTASIAIRGTKVNYSTLEFSWLKSRFEDIETLEPTTLTWIDEATPNSVLWDVGVDKCWPDTRKVGSTQRNLVAALATKQKWVARGSNPGPAD